MREIKFRGISLYTGIWIYGYACFDSAKENAVVINKTGNNKMQHWAVEPNSVSQFTGLRDRNGKEIYEGDIVRVWHDRGDDDAFYTVGVVEYSPAEFYIRGGGYSITCHFHYNDYEREIIGNIYENPELLNK